MQLNLHNQTFLLSEHKALFWLEQKMLIIADAHFSKETHFRKNGVAIPAGILQNDLRRMETMIDTFDPDQILFLGDMFHSEENDGLNEFLNWRKTFSSLKITLVIGNHDIYWGGNFEQVGNMLKAGSIDQKNIKFFLGYSGWSPGQLQGEMEDNSWIVTPAKSQYIFDIENKELWKKVLNDLGGEYKQITNYPEDPILN